MSTARVTQTRTSLRDLDGIWDYLAESDPERASRFIRQLRDRMEVLAEHPMMGRSRDDLSSNLRSFPFGDHVVFYYPAEDGVIIARVLHGRRNIEGLFG